MQKGQDMEQGTGTIASKERAVQAAESYRELARVFSSYLPGQSIGEEKNKIRYEIVEKLCVCCPKYGHCWEDRKEDCHDAFSYIGELAEKNGRLEHIHLPEFFRTDCISALRLLEEWNTAVQLERMKQAAYRQIMEGKTALVRQLEDTAQCFLKISEQEGLCAKGSEAEEKELTAWLKQYHLRIRNVVLEEKKGKGRSWGMTIRGDRRKGVSVRMLERLFSERYGVPVKEELQYTRMISDEESEILLREQPRYEVLTGVARSVKREQEVSGDSFSLFYEEDGEMTMILSDGMGSGASAAKESEAVLGILEKMLAAGFREETAIRLINSVLALRAEQRSFATLDISRINLYTAMCEFIKIGGAATYIKRGNWMESVSAKTLPVGMVQHMDYDSAIRKLYHGDTVIMVSDGVLEVIPEGERERFLTEVIGEDAEQKPQVMAGRILNAALLLQNYEPKDDMTVLVCSIFEQKSR